MTLKEYLSKAKDDIEYRLRHCRFSSKTEIYDILDSSIDRVISEAVKNNDLTFFDKELISPLLKSISIRHHISKGVIPQGLSKKEILIQICNLTKVFFKSFAHQRNTIFTFSNETVESIIDDLNSYFSMIDAMVVIHQTHIKMIEQEKIREVSKCSLIEKYKNVLQTYQRILGDTYKMENTTLSDRVRERIESDLMSMGFDIIGYDGNNDSLFDIRRTVFGEDEMVFPTIMQNEEIILRGLIFKK